MNYPKLANWLRFKKINENEYIIKNDLLNKHYKLDSYTFWFARQLDGKTNPYKIDKTLKQKDVDLILARLRNKDIIRDNRFLCKSVFALLVTVWRPKVSIKTRLIAFILNTMLVITWFPTILFSAFNFFNSYSDINIDYLIIGGFIGVIVGLIFHELGHMIACLSYGGKVYELGIMLRCFLPGAYVLINEKNIKSTIKKIQINAVGVEMNFLLAGLFLFLSSKIYLLSGFFLGAAINNIFLGVLNLTFINGFDGVKILSEIFGVDDLVQRSKDILSSSFRIKRLYHNGIIGKATLSFCCIVVVLQIALPFTILINIFEVILWFV